METSNEELGSEGIPCCAASTADVLAQALWKFATRVANLLRREQWRWVTVEAKLAPKSLRMVNRGNNDGVNGAGGGWEIDVLRKLAMVNFMRVKGQMEGLCNGFEHRNNNKLSGCCFT